MIGCCRAGGGHGEGEILVILNGGESLREVSEHCPSEAQSVRHNWVRLRFLPTTVALRTDPAQGSYLEDKAQGKLGV